MGNGTRRVAKIDADRAALLAGQAERLKNDARKADELLRLGKIDEARELLAQNAHYACTLWHELTLAIEPPREPRVRGKSRGR